MITEITSACAFIGKKLTKDFPPEQVLSFQQFLSQALQKLFANHWTPLRPYKGNAFRSLCVCNGHVDKVITDAAIKAGISNIAIYLPNDMTIWVDPYCVSYRLGNESVPGCKKKKVVAIWENFSKPENLEIPIFSRGGVRRLPSPDSPKATQPQLHYGNAPTTTSVSSPLYISRSTSAYQPFRQNTQLSESVVTSTNGYSRYIPASQNRSHYSYNPIGYMTSSIAPSMTQPSSIQHKIVMAN
ncbi:Protein btg1 [Nowakowskiella sp. JEL0078]|nr:Protein btg1 [Nowakowskiella sp. JEL0078]